MFLQISLGSIIQVERYGWRFYSGKGFEADIKWIPTVMVEVAKTAVQRIKRLSADARKLAEWIENHPDKFYRHENCPKVSDDSLLSTLQVCHALGLKAETIHESKSVLEAKKLSSHEGYYTLNTLWQVVLENLPSQFPWFDQEKGIKYSQALFVLNRNQLHGNRGSSPVGLHKPNATFFNNDLNPRLALGDAHKSIFDRHGYYSETGDRLKITSHQARHLLNTIAQRGGLSNLEIAKWSGRADVKQNRTYNHMAEYEFVAMAEQIDPDKALFGPIGNVEHHLPVTPQEFNTLERAAAHVTEYGYCVHDYTMSPCEKFRDCINCTEQVCIKGNTAKLELLHERLSRTEQLISGAEQAASESDMGADRWLQHHIKTAKRLRELISILVSPEIEDGAQVKLRGNDFSQLRRVAEKKNTQKKLEEKHQKPDEAAMLEDLTTMLGGGFG